MTVHKRRRQVSLSALVLTAGWGTVCSAQRQAMLVTAPELRSEFAIAADTLKESHGDAAEHARRAAFERIQGNMFPKDSTCSAVFGNGDGWIVYLWNKCVNGHRRPGYTDGEALVKVNAEFRTTDSLLNPGGFDIVGLPE